MRLVNANGRDITPCGVVTMTISLGKFSASHVFIVVDQLVILECNFHGYMLDFKQCTFYRAQDPEEVLQLLPVQATPQPLHTLTMDDE